MKAHEVLKRYEAGRRDFSGENLRGQSFKGKDLSGANFSEADIRGANFTNARLRNANFKESKAGLQRRWRAFLVGVSLLLSGLSGVASGQAGTLVINLLDPRRLGETIIVGITNFVLLAVFFTVTIRRGLIAAFTAVGWILVAVIAIAVALPLVVREGSSTAMAVLAAVVMALALFGTIAMTLAGTIAASIARVWAVALALIQVGVWVIAGALTVINAGAGSLPGSKALAVAVAGSFALLGAYIARQTLAQDQKFALIRPTAIAITATGGTSFRNADLTDANFTCATLKSTDFRKATLTRTRWHQAKKLDRVRPGTTYLQTAKIQQLLIKGQGQAQNFDRQPLRCINLQGANLADASFIGADLSSANLQDADLSRAKLVQTQLDEADLTGATLTGAYIEDWGITSHTKLNGVMCEYVFMRVPTKEDPNPRRKPDNWKETFKDGDFADFIKPIVDTLDLYHNQDVDPRAIAISFKQLAENHPDAELEIVAMEKRGGNKFLLRAATAPDANHSELNAEYFATYNEIKALAEREIKALIDEKDSRISSLENMIATALQRPSFYVETNKGDIMSESKGNINITSGDSSKISGIAGAGESVTGSAMADINGSVSIAINELPNSPQSDKLGIKELLAQLQTAINDPALPDDDKTQALEQLKVLAEAGQNPNNETAQKQAKKAIGFLKVIAEGLPSAATLVVACKDILPAIAHFFGF